MPLLRKIWLQFIAEIAEIAEWCRSCPRTISPVGWKTAKPTSTAATPTCAIPS